MPGPGSGIPEHEFKRRRQPERRSSIGRFVLVVAALIAALYFIFGCSGSPLAPEPVTDRRGQLYADVLRCSDLPPRPMPAVYFLEADPETGAFPCSSPAGCLGSWAPGAVYLADSPAGRSGFPFQHESLHELLGGDPLHSHPSWKACDLEPGDQPIVLTLE